MADEERSEDSKRPPSETGKGGEEAAKRAAAEADHGRRRLQRLEYEQEELQAKRPSRSIRKLEEES